MSQMSGYHPVSNYIHLQPTIKKEQHLFIPWLSLWGEVLQVWFYLELGILPLSPLLPCSKISPVSEPGILSAESLLNLLFIISLSILHLLSL